MDPAVQEDPEVPPASPAAKSRGYAIGANRISAGGTIAFTDTTPHVYNAELIKPLATPYTMTVNVAGPGTVASSPYSGINCPGHSCSATYLPGTEVTLVATPDTNAAFAGWSTCTGKSTCTMSMSANVSVTATFTRAATASVTPAQKDFGSRKVGTKVTATFTVMNTATKGVADLTIGTASVGGTDAGQFKLVEGKDRCSGQTIEPGRSCTFQVSFVPASANTKTATITIPSNDPRWSDGYTSHRCRKLITLALKARSIWSNEKIASAPLSWYCGQSFMKPSYECMDKGESTMIHKNLTTNRGDPIYQKSEPNYPAASFGVWTGGAIMRKVVLPVFLLFLFVAASPFRGYAGTHVPDLHGCQDYTRPDSEP